MDNFRIACKIIKSKSFLLHFVQFRLQIRCLQGVEIFLVPVITATLDQKNNCVFIVLASKSCTAKICYMILLTCMFSNAYFSFIDFLVPENLDVRLKGVLLAACFSIVSFSCFHIPYVSIVFIPQTFEALTGYRVPINNLFSQVVDSKCVLLNIP